ncbi:MAG: alpha/beta hydrolase [Syntrophomonadaceae bacterium]|nr:alpha/beta hydrolase [Syntrophomonadaceae bacterium]
MIIRPEYVKLDQQPRLADYLLFPRTDHTPPPPGAFDRLIPIKTEKGLEIQVACRFFPDQANWPWILYFHGNGEVAADYNYFYRSYHARKINLVVADYRGYGMSSGQTTFQSLAQDAHDVYRTVREELVQRNYSSALWVMGRSLGSMPALELAFHYPKELRGLIIESGFASVTRLARQWGLPVDLSALLPLEEQCLDMIRAITLPALVMHGELDHLVFPEEGRLVYDTLGSSKKRLLLLSGANHNDIMLVNPELYFKALEEFVQRT